MFAEIPEQESNFKRTQFLKIIPNVTLRLRILDKKAHMVFKHFIRNQRVSVVCLNEECTVCMNNQKLIRENVGVPTSQIKGYIPRSARYLVNVYNRTPVKQTVDGEVVYPDVHGKFPASLASIETKPLNRVEILERGSTLFQQFNVINSQVTDKDEKPVGLWNYDIVLTASGQGRNMTITALPMPDKNDELDIPEEDIYVLSTIPLEFTADELLKILSGVSYQDILTSRRSDDTEVSIDPDVASVLESSLENLFAD
jgi:hypothetical protein